MSNLEKLTARAERVRRFNRFYTRQVGVLDEHLMGSDYSITEARILFELATREGLTSSDLCRELDLNAGYLSRVIAGFEKAGLVVKHRSTADARVSELVLTEKGRAAFEPLNAGSRREVMQLLDRLSEADQQQLVEAMERIQRVFGERTQGYILRDPRPGDMGWVIHKHAALYTQEYGWNTEFEALVAEIVARYIREYDARAERCWIAEKDGAPVGSVFVVRQDAETAKLRLLYVDASARGLGIGHRLVDECLRFARSAGYKRMVLWTNSVLVDALRIYEKAGFQIVKEEQHHNFGKDQVEQVWARDL